jgi:hypothetical protein
VGCTCKTGCQEHAFYNIHDTVSIVCDNCCHLPANSPFLRYGFHRGTEIARSMSPLHPFGGESDWFWFPPVVYDMGTHRQIWVLRP